MSQFQEQIYRHTTASATRSWRERRGRYLIEGTRCKNCGRPRAYIGKFQLCRICFRELASTGRIPGVTKASW